MMLLATLLALTSSLALILAYKLRRLQNERDRLLHEKKEDSKVLFLKSRYASMGETVGNIAHQWKQPLNAIGTIQNSIKASLIYQGEISKEKLLNSVETSFKLLRHLAETIDTFYSFLSQRNGEQMSFTVADELEKIRKITEYSFTNSRITLHFELEVNPTIQGNANEFTHALLNLILNAKDALDDADVADPRITVHVGEGDDMCRITVNDNAGGIRLYPIDMVFDLHVTTKESGSGLGLFMTRNIIENRFKGHLSVENTKEGACFTIDLPYSEYGEYFTDTITLDHKISLERIQQLSNKIMELKGVEKDLRKWADIFKRAHWGIAIHLGRSDNFEMTNNAFNLLYGYTPKEIASLTVAELFTPESLEALPSVQKEAFEKGYVVFETIHRRKDGTTFPASIELIVVKDEEGEILYHITNIWDLSEKKAAEERLLLKKFALDYIKDAVFLIDENANFHYVNEGACKALGYTCKEFEDMNVGDIDPDWPRERWSEHWNALKEVGSITMELRHRHQNGTIFPVEVSTNYIEFGGKAYNMAIARDITERRLLEEQKDNERMRLFFERQLVGMAITSPEYGWIHTNEKLQEMLGYSHDELCSLTWTEMTYPDDLPTDMEQFGKLFRGEIEDYMLEKRFIRKDRSIVYTNLSVSCVRNDDRSVNYVLALLEDITERKAAQEALAAKEREFRSLTENIPDNIARWDTEGKYLYINPVQERLLGVEPADVIGKRLSEAFPEINFSAIDCAIFQVLATGEPIRFLRQLVPIEDGVEIHEINLVPERDVNGTIVSVLGIGRDMTSIYRLQDELAEREKELRALADSSPGMMGTFHLRPDGSIYMPYVSPNIIDIFGLQPQDVREDASLLMAMTHPDDVQRVYESINESAQTMYVWHEEYRINHPLKGERWMESNAMPQPHPNGGVVWYGYIHDITERKKVEKQLTRSETGLKEAQKIAKIGSWELELPAQKLTWSDETYRIFEIDQEQTDDLHTIFYDTVHPDDREIVNKVFEESLKNKLPFEIVHRIMIGGRIKYVLESCETQYDTDGNPLLSIGTVQDITERKKMEDELLKSLEFNEGIIAAIPDLLFETTPDGTYVGVWAQNEELLIAQRTALLGKNFKEVLPPDAVDVSIQAMKEVDEKGVSLGKTYSLDLPEGKRWFELSVSKKKMSGNYISLARDITERKQHEELLQEKEQKFRTLSENSPDLIIRYDSQLRRTYVNPAWVRINGISANEVLGKTLKEKAVFSTSSSSQGAIYNEHLQQVLHTGKSVDFDFIFSSNAFPDMEQKHFIVSFVPEFDEDGHISNVLAVARDITERKQMEESIRSLNTTLEKRIYERTSQLQEALEFSEGVINALPNLLFEIDSNGSYLNVWARDEELLAAQKELLLNHTLHDVLSKEAADTVMEALEEADLKGTSFGKTIKIELPQGTRYFEQSVSKKSSSNTFLVLSHDITKNKQIENALRESEETFRALVENSPDVISRYDLQMRRTYVNPMMQFLLGRPLEEILGKTPREFSPLPDIDTFEQLFNAVVWGKSELEYEGVYLSPWGETRWGNQRLIPEFDSDHNVISVMVIGRDMTERIEAEKELREREDKFHQLFKLSPAAISITSLERNMYLEVNDSFLAHTQYDRDEVIGKGSTELGIFVYPEERDELFRRIMYEGVVTNFHYSYRSKYGNVHYAAAFGSVIMFKGEKCFLGHSYDMNAAKEIEQLQNERLALEARLSKLAASVPGVNYIFEKSTQGTYSFTYLAPTFESFFGFPLDDVMGDFALLMDHIHSEDRERILQSIHHTAEHLSDWHEVFRLVHPKKGTVWIEGHSSPEKQPDDSTQWYGFFRDITKRQQG